MRNFKSLIFLAVFCLSAAFFWFSIFPLLRTTNELRSSEQTLRKQVAELTEQEKKIQETVQFSDTISNDQKELMELAVPSVANTPALAAHLAELARDNGMSLESVQVEPPFAQQQTNESIETSGTAITPLEIAPSRVTLQLSGNDYTLLAPFLQSVEKSLRIFDVRSVFVTKKKVEGKGDIITFSIAGDAYFTPTE